MSVCCARISWDNIPRRGMSGTKVFVLCLASFQTNRAERHFRVAPSKTGLHERATLIAIKLRKMKLAHNQLRENRLQGASRSTFDVTFSPHGDWVEIEARVCSTPALQPLACETMDRFSFPQAFVLYSACIVHPPACYVLDVIC